MNSTSYTAAHEDAAWRDMSHFGRFRVTGKDAAALLHHLTTNDVKKLKAGEGCDAALVTNKARLLDLLTIFRLDGDESGFLVVTSPNRREMFKPHAQKFVLFRQDIQIEDVTAGSAFYGIFGPRAADAFAPLLASASEPPINTIQQVELGAGMARVARTRRLPHANGFFMWGDAAQLQAWVLSTGKPLVDGDTYNVLRVEAGIPVAGLELTEETNPWEANMGAMISLSKGCYNGQEVIARLNTYKKVKQNLQGLKLQSPIPMGEQCALKANGRNAGFLSSSIESPRFGPIALAYVRNAYNETGQTVQVIRSEESQTATVVDLPFAAGG